MNRRHFVKAGVSSLVIPAAVISVAAAPGRAGLVSDRFYFDERFAEARRRAEDWSGSAPPIPVHGDVTAIWMGGLARASITAPLLMHGATTESFYFCLKVLLHDQVRVSSEVSRIDRDLHLWTIRTDHHYRKGTPA